MNHHLRTATPADEAWQLAIYAGTRADWAAKLRTVLTDRDTNARLQREAMARTLPRWANTARTLQQGLLA